MHSSSDQDLRRFCKKIEDDINKRFFSQFNSLSFIELAGSLIEEHLLHLLSIREAVDHWLDYMDLPARDEITAIAKKIIENEERLDRLDDTLFHVLLNIQTNRKLIAALISELDGIQQK